MMRYICSECKEIFNESEIVVNSYTEKMGEFWGAPAYETFYEDHCPYCGSNYIEEYYEEGNDDLQSDFEN